jgi:hypothetical protein
MARTWRVAMILPPDFLAPPSHKRQRFPPQGPAIVAASIADHGFVTYAVDLEARLNARPLNADPSRLEDDEAVAAYLSGAPDPAIEGVIDELVSRIDDREHDLIALSIDRGTQVNVTTLLAVELKRRWQKPIVVGGIATDDVLALLERTGARGPDIVTRASTPPQIRAVFEALRDGRMEGLVQIGRRGPDATFGADDWPMPDFGIYELALYRRDPIAAGGDYARYDGAVGARLVLPYHFAYECQFSCAFCQTDGQNVTKSIPLVVRELAALAEKHDCREFALFDAQINMQARAFAEALIAARLDLRWSDSYRVRPSPPGDLEVMAAGGCAAITVGVESANDRILKKMVKGHKKEHAHKLVADAHAANILLRVNLLPCFPGETREEHLETCAWIEEHARFIDDLAPSSFYLSASSPIGQKPERFGVRIREPRSLHGITKFRKVLHTLAYDEIDGMTWEERQPTLARAEEELRAAWARGRGSEAGLSPGQMLALRRTYATKAEITSALDRWRGASPEPAVVVKESAIRPRITAPEGLDRASVARFADAFRAAPGLRARLGRGSSAHALLFAGGAFLFFHGSVSRDGARATRVEIEAPLFARGDDELIARCAPGSTIELGVRDVEVISFRMVA